MLFLNYKPVLHQPTGIGVYANAVLPTLKDFEHMLISGGGSASVQQRLQRLAWSQFQLPRLAKKRKASLIFTPAPEGYLGEQVVPQVVFVHDLRPLCHPEQSMQSLYFKNWVPPLLRQCRHIITNSNFTASEIIRATGVFEDKISVTPLGYDSNHFYPSQVIQRLHSRPYFLHIGQAYPHKNLERLIYSFNSIAHHFPEVDLVSVGKPHLLETERLKQLTSELGLIERVIFKSYVVYGDLPNWYRGALALVYPSLWEGFGLPILEAMACGCPVITSFGSGMEEVANGAAYLINPWSISQIAEALKELIENHNQRNLMQAAGLTNARSYSWSSCSEQTRSLIRSLLA